MHLSAPIHVQEPDPQAPHRRLAITLWPNPPHGIEAWVGTLRIDAGDKPADKVEPHHYLEKHSVHVCCWDDLWRYFLGTPHENLARAVRESLGLSI